MRDLAGHFCLRVFHEVVDKLLLGESYSCSEAGLGLKALPPRSLSWRLWSVGSSCTLAVGLGPESFLAHWRWASPEGSSKHSSQLPQREWCQRQSNQDRATVPLNDLVSKAAHVHSHSTLFFQNESLSAAHSQAEGTWTPLLQEGTPKSSWTHV